MRADLWTCPHCDRQFANTNQQHSCGRFTVEQFLAWHGAPERELFERFAALAASCGDVTTAPARTRVGFQARMIFAAVNRLAPGQLDAHVVLARHRDDARFRKIEKVGPRSYVHHFTIRTVAELDETVRAWLREAYDVGEQRHLG